MNLSMSENINMTPIDHKLCPHFKNLEDALVDVLEDSLYNELEDKLCIQLYSATNDSVEFELSYE